MKGKNGAPDSLNNAQILNSEFFFSKSVTLSRLES